MSTPLQAGELRSLADDLANLTREQQVRMRCDRVPEAASSPFPFSREELALANFLVDRQGQRTENGIDASLRKRS